MAQSAVSNCEICVQASGFQYCTQCCQYFCENCKKSHLRTNMSRNHIFRNSNETAAIHREKISVCKHGDFIFMCTDCEVPLCKVCLVEYHNGHQVADINICFTSLRGEAKQILSKTVTEINYKIDELNKINETFFAECDKVVQDISNEGAMLKKMVDNVVASMQTNVRENQKEQRKIYSKEVLQILLSTHVKRLQDELDELVESKTHGSSFVTMKTLLTKLRNLKVPEVPQAPCISYGATVAKESDIKKLLGTLSLSQFPNSKTIVLHRQSTAVNLGFGFCGGQDMTESIYISTVHTDSVAAKAGLQPGDLIVSVNGTPLDGVEHNAVGNIFKNAKGAITFVVVTPSSQ